MFLIPIYLCSTEVAEVHYLSGLARPLLVYVLFGHFKFVFPYFLLQTFVWIVP